MEGTKRRKKNKGKNHKKKELEILNLLELESEVGEKLNVNNRNEFEWETEHDLDLQFIEDCSEGEIGETGGIDDIDLDDTFSHKTFKERALELQMKTQGEFSHFVKRILTPEDWLRIHRVIRKSKGLKSKFMLRNLSPFLFDSEHTASWKCKYCDDHVASPVKNYMNHLTLIHGIGIDDEPAFPCDVCGDYVNGGVSKYILHWVPHLMEHSCPICKKTFALNCHMKYHYKVVHEEGEQCCSQCGKLMKNELAMRRHIRLFHSNKTNWKICDICGKCVKSRCLEPHKLTHSQDRPYKCETCKKCFKTPSTLYQHQKVHATDSKAHKYLCEYCGKRFKHHTSWNLHVVRIHEGEYEHECLVCHKRFHKLFELKKHSVKHSEERPFPCSVCLKCFKTKTHLKEHLTIHSNEKSHICPLCGKGIRMKANLYKHLKVHRNRGEYVPPLNGSASSAFGTLTRVINKPPIVVTKSLKSGNSKELRNEEMESVQLIIPEQIGNNFPLVQLEEENTKFVFKRKGMEKDDDPEGILISESLDSTPLVPGSLFTLLAGPDSPDGNVEEQRSLGSLTITVNQGGNLGGTSHQDIYISPSSNGSRTLFGGILNANISNVHLVTSSGEKPILGIGTGTLSLPNGTLINFNLNNSTLTYNNSNE